MSIFGRALAVALCASSPALAGIPSSEEDWSVMYEQCVEGARGAVQQLNLDASFGPVFCACMQEGARHMPAKEWDVPPAKSPYFSALQARCMSVGRYAVQYVRPPQQQQPALDYSGLKPLAPTEPDHD